DWSSDVCSSDLLIFNARAFASTISVAISVGETIGQLAGGVRRIARANCRRGSRVGLKALQTFCVAFCVVVGHDVLLGCAIKETLQEADLLGVRDLNQLFRAARRTLQDGCRAS